MEREKRMIENNIQEIYQEDDKTIWCILQRDTYLYRIDLKKGIMNEVQALLDEEYMYKAFSDMIAYKQYFIFIPGCSKDIVIFDRNNQMCEKIPLPFTEKKIGTSDTKFFTGVIDKNYLYMFGYSYPGIIKLDIVQKKIFVIDSWLESIQKKFKSKMDGCFHKKYYLLNHIVYFPFMNMNAVMKFDLETEKVVIQEIGDSLQRYISIEWDGNNFWLIPRDGSTGSIIKWNLISNRIEDYNQYPEKFNYEQYAFFRTVNIGDKILLFAHRANINISIDISTGKMLEFSDIYDVSNFKNVKYPFAVLKEKQILFLNQNKCIWWNYVSGEKRYCFYSLSEKIYKRYEEKQIRDYFDNLKQGTVIRENKNNNIKTLIKYLQICERK